MDDRTRDDRTRDDRTRDDRTQHDQVYRTQHDQVYRTPTTPPRVHLRHPGYTVRAAPWRPCMLSRLKSQINQAEKAPEVNLEQTIYLLAAFQVPCCKNHPCSKAPGYLALPYPCEILSRMGTLP